MGAMPKSPELMQHSLCMYAYAHCVAGLTALHSDENSAPSVPSQDTYKMMYASPQKDLLFSEVPTRCITRCANPSTKHQGLRRGKTSFFMLYE